ncbi:formin-like protein 8 [Apium graveolens]|uniref:formin-like protein 8 n=1 Tax=Apium graveolens TaxID=4045 RepID=UPI003D7B9D97
MKMNKLQSCTFILYILIICCRISTLPKCSCQSNTQNIETFYPFEVPPISPAPDVPDNQPPASPQPRSSSSNSVMRAVIATAASTVFISALFFVFVLRHVRQKRNHAAANASFRNIHSIEPRRGDKFVRVNENMKRVIVDEEGLDVWYLRDLEGEKNEAFNKDEIFDIEEENILKPAVQETPFLRGHSFSFRSRDHVEKGQIEPVVRQESSVQLSSPSLRLRANSRATPALPTAVVSPSALQLPPPTPLPKKTTPVWDEVNGDSFRADGDLMEALFGSVATNRKSPKRVGNMSSPKRERNSPPSKIFILDARKSQDISIILRSLSVSRKEIIDALTEGQDLDVNILEKLNRIAPTTEEVSDILAFDDDHTRLADAESFLYHVLKAVPSAFTRFNAMLVGSNYDSQVLFLKQSLQTLESGCKELRTRGLLPKLIEAVLKAGNQMNAETSHGNTKAFNLTFLQKLSDVKSTDGNTTLLHFVVEEVVRAEGKRCVINKSRSLNSSSSSSSSIRNYGGQMLEKPMQIKDMENEYIMLGLPIVGGISSQFSSVKKSATLDYDALNKASSTLSDNVAEIRKLVGECAISGGGEGFIKKMKTFLDASEGELRVARKEFTTIMELVKRTTEYYQAGASKDIMAQPLQLFVIVKDFLAMVDQACIDITRNMQKRKTEHTSNSTAYKNSAKFPLLPANFMSDTSKSSSRDSGNDSIIM